MSDLTELLPITVRTTLDDVLSASEVDVMRLAEDLFGVADILRADSRLRRALSDPARTVSDKEDLVSHAFARSVESSTCCVLNSMSAVHWSQPDVLPDITEMCGIYVTLMAAKRADALETVENELLRVQEILSDNRQLRMSLSDMGTGTAHERAELAHAIFHAHLSPYTMRLIRRAVGRTVHGRLLSKLRMYAETAALVDTRVLVTVDVAAPLSPEQAARLRKVMSERLKSDVTLAVTVDPQVMGGFRLRAGNESVDATISARLTELRRALAGSSSF
ncbi:MULTISPECIES: ATP synthase F1 subunit delta [unclassified Schaalia]|uniref:ATP synthase F1 subunit delta n=1 Tax=unclassified Schaalia TaxID=2691889 RepID=UPI001E4EA64A|nr:MULTISPECIES: ATP synthase F1 subunit delta [unclassified Schaalia]MCD4549646.1 ATP synthase F1 subunit delta [Schaalia sp. lx-260]MCD4556709.1 ATP synthase F1 subunit delta [Schaalia sp. lx-100]